MKLGKKLVTGIWPEVFKVDPFRCKILKEEVLEMVKMFLTGDLIRDHTEFL